MAEVRIMQFSLKCSSAPTKFDDEIRRGFPRSGAQTRVGVDFDFVIHAISGKRCEIELR